MMKKQAALFAIVASLTFAWAGSAASTPSANSAGAKDPQPATQLREVAPAAGSAQTSPKTSHTFRVNDKKGLLLTCVAPQIDADANTDIFEDCALAPGRTLDDVMHSFIGAIHYEQDQHAQERAQWTKDQEEKSNQKASEK
ncbi:MAG: hypothetical protein ABSE87_01710 [Terracidiphilus sp.]|jgi:hypothetical protein